MKIFIKLKKFVSKIKNYKQNKNLKKTIKRDKKYRARYNMGFASYAGREFYVANPQLTTIGKYCSIGNKVCLGLTQHPTDCLTTHGFIVNRKNPRFEGLLDVEDNAIDFPMDTKIKPPITIGNDVWIGYRSIIMDGLTIGDGAIIAAGSIVTKNVPPYTIVAGVPAKPIKTRFSNLVYNNVPVTSKLLELKWWDFPVEFVRKLPFQDIEKCIEILEKNIHLREG